MTDRQVTQETAPDTTGKLVRESKEDRFEEDRFDDMIAPGWGARRKPLPGILGEYRLTMILIVVVVALGAIVLMRLLTPQSNQAGQLAQLQARVESLENRFNMVSGLRQQMDHLERELNAVQVEPLAQRLNRLEENVALRLNQFATELAEMRQKTQAPQITAPPAVRPAPAAPPRPPAGTAQRHEVAPGETLFGISRRYNLSVEELLRLNNLAPDAVIKPGQTLTVRP